MQYHVSESQDNEPKSLRLSVLHLFVLVTACAVSIAIWQGTVRAEMPSPYYYLTALHALVNGLQLAGAVIFVGWVLPSHPPLRREPGHWLTTFHAAMFLALRLNQFFQWLFVGGTDAGESPIGWYRVAMALTALIMAAFAVGYLLAALICMKETRWRCITGILSASLAAQALFWLTNVFETPFSFQAYEVYRVGATGLGVIVFFATLGVAAYDVVACHLRRDWLHWNGVVCLLASTLISIAFHIVSWVTG